MKSFLKNEAEHNLFDELENIKAQLCCAYSEFNNARDDLHINAAVFRLCELETRQSIILNQIRRGNEW
ncbi:MAG: hypothetical protein IJZ88_02800 [Clostridia bacterium]|nr:hypothetical protein [Clostridia bacterium]